MVAPMPGVLGHCGIRRSVDLRAAEIPLWGRLPAAVLALLVAEPARPAEVWFAPGRAPTLRGC
ncbi:hypothetical protein [Streptomyces sp. NPDC054783]